MNTSCDLQTVLAIGAHPDDFELGAAGLLFRLRKECKADLHFATMTFGEDDPRTLESRRSSLFLHGFMDNNVLAACEEGTLGQLNGINEGDNQATKAVAALLAAADALLSTDSTVRDFAHSRLHCGGLPLNELGSVGHRPIAFIERLIETIQPDILLTHSSADLHSDHRDTHDATLSAARNFHGTILFYQSPSTIPSGYAPTYFTALSERELLVKKLSILCHSSQQGRKAWFMNPSYVNLTAQAWSQFHRMPEQMLEAFVVYQSFWFNPKSGASHGNP